MLEEIEVDLKINRELSDEEISKIEDSSTAFLGGNSRGYVEIKKIPQKKTEYVFILRIK